MNYYALYNDKGRLIGKRSSENEMGGPNYTSLSKEEWEALNVSSEQEIFDLKEQLRATDYIACKIAEGAATREDYADVLALRAKWRARINELMGE